MCSKKKEETKLSRKKFKIVMSVVWFGSAPGRNKQAGVTGTVRCLWEFLISLLQYQAKSRACKFYLSGEK